MTLWSLVINTSTKRLQTVCVLRVHHVAKRISETMTSIILENLKSHLYIVCSISSGYFTEPLYIVALCQSHEFTELYLYSCSLLYPRLYRASCLQTFYIIISETLKNQLYMGVRYCARDFSEPAPYSCSISYPRLYRTTFKKLFCIVPETFQSYLFTVE